MELVSVVIEVPKEAKEVVDAVCGVVAHFVNKKPLADAAALLPALLRAAEGVGQVADEIKSAHREELSAYVLKSLWEAMEKSPIA